MKTICIDLSSKMFFTKIYIYHFLINIFIKISSQSYVSKTVSLSKTTLFFFSTDGLHVLEEKIRYDALTRIRPWHRVSRVGYAGGVRYFFFREYWIRRLIRIGLVDTAQPNKTVPYPSIPDARASYARTPARPRLAPHPRSPTAGHRRRASAPARRRRASVPARRPPATSFRPCDVDPGSSQLP